VLDVEHQHAMPAVFEVIANAGCGDIEKLARGFRGVDGGRSDEQEQSAPQRRRQGSHPPRTRRKAGNAGILPACFSING